jgi:TonB-dependent receptor
VTVKLREKGTEQMRTSRWLAGTALLMTTTAGWAQDALPAADAAASADEIVVTGQRAQQLRAIEAKRAAIGVLDVSAADEIGRLPDRNVAEVVERLPGVGVTYDQGEGRFVAIRGVPSNLNGYTINGFEIGNPDGATRSLPLDIISGQLLNRVEVAKVKTADMDGQGIGGNINLVTQTAFDFRERTTLAVNAQAGHQQFNDKVPVRGDASVATRFGSDDQFGIVLGGSYSDRTFVSYGFYPDSWTPDSRWARGGAPINIKYTNYTIERERIGASGSFDWHVGDHTKLYVRGLYSRYAEHEQRPRYRLDFGTTLVPNADGLTGTATGVATPASGIGTGSGPERRVDYRTDDKIKSVLTGAIGGSSEYDRVTLDYGIDRVHNTVSDKIPLWQFRCNPGTIDVDFADTIYSATPRAECTGNQLQFRQYSYQDQEGEEDIWQAKVDATYRLPGLGENSFIKVGAKYRTTDKSLDQTNDVWTRGSTTATRFTLGQFNLQGSSFNVYPDGDNSSHAYLNAPTIDGAAIAAFTEANLPGPYFVKDVATSLANNSLSDLDIDEDVTAAYVMAQLGFGALTVIPGVRFEHSKLGIGGFRLDNGTTVVPLHFDNSYDDVLPSLILKLTPTEQTIFRLAYSKSIGRPEYSQLTPGGTLSTSTTDSLSSGNPALKPYRADNLDLTGEYYFAPGGLLSVGAFAKWIKNPIFTQTQTQTNVTYAGVVYPLLQVSQPFNADSGHIYGIEAQYQQQFTFLPGLLSGFGVSLTGTLVKSSVRTFDGRKTTFPNQSGHLYGAELFYQKGPFEASVAYHVTGHALLLLGATANDDQYNNDLRRLDAKASVAVWKDVNLFVEAQNLTDEPTRQYQAGNKNWIIQNERYGRTFYAGVSAKF